MLVAKNYLAKIEITSALVVEPEIPDWTGFTVSNRYGEAETGFTITLNRPINLSIGDTVTISDGFGSTLIPLVVNKEIEGTSGSIGQTRITGLGSKLTRRGPVKHTVYINRAWLSQRCPAYYLYETGSGPYSVGYSSQIILQYNPGANPLQYEGVARVRLLLAELPGKDTKDNEFGCFVEFGLTRQDIARKLAAMCDYEIVTNMPDLPIQKAYTVYANQTYWQSLIQLFADWKPMIFVREDKIYIMDVGVDRQAKTGNDTIQLSEDSFTLYNWNIQKNFSPIDHIVVHGPDSQYTYVGRSQSVSKRRLTEVTLPGQNITQQFEESEEYDGDDELEKTLYQIGGLNRPKRTVRTIVKRQDPFNPENEATISEKIEVYDGNNDKISQTETEYKHAGWNKPLKSITTEYGRIGIIGGGTTPAWSVDSQGNKVKVDLPSAWEWKKLSETTIEYRDYYEDVGQVECDVKQFCLCVYYKDTEKHEGEDYYLFDQMKPHWQALQAGDYIWEERDENDLGWDSAWQLYKQETIRLDKASPTMYRKTRTTTTMFPIKTTKPAYEDVPIPRTRQNSIIRRKWEYFWVGGALLYYESGAYPTGDFHPRIDIVNLDVVDEETARKLAYRNFTASQTTTGTATIETTLPLHNIFVGGTIALPACTKDVLAYTDGNIAGYQEITIEAKTYWIVGHERIVEYSGEVGESGRDIRVYDRIELQEYF